MGTRIEISPMKKRKQKIDRATPTASRSSELLAVLARNFRARGNHLYDLIPKLKPECVPNHLLRAEIMWDIASAINNAETDMSTANGRAEMPRPSGGQ